MRSRDVAHEMMRSISTTGSGSRLFLDRLFKLPCGLSASQAAVSERTAGKSPVSMARQGPQGGGNFGADGRLRGGAHGLSKITRDAAGKADDFDRAGASFRRRRKRALTDQTSLSTVSTSAKSVVEAATILLLALSAIFDLVSCAPTLPAASFEQARECRGLLIPRTYLNKKTESQLQVEPPACSNAIPLQFNDPSRGPYRA
jgi:hypothetical protein